MDTKISLLVTSFFLLFSFAYLFADEKDDVLKVSENISENSAMTVRKDNYYFNIFENGEVEFKQLISWENLFGVLYYEISIREK